MKHSFFRKLRRVLVFDKIPTNIKRVGLVPILRHLNQRQYLEALLEKLLEEAHELKEDRSINELIDVCEVVDAIRRNLKITAARLERQRRLKRKYSGRFTANSFIVKVVDPSGRSNTQKSSLPRNRGLTT